MQKQSKQKSQTIEILSIVVGADCNAGVEGWEALLRCRVMIRLSILVKVSESYLTDH